MSIMRLVKVAFFTVLFTVVGVPLLLFLFIFFSPLWADRSDEELFRDLIMDPMPSSVTNLVVRRTSGAGDSNTRFLFQIAPEDFSNLITPRFESRLLSEDVLRKIFIPKKIFFLQEKNTNYNIKIELNSTHIFNIINGTDDYSRTIVTDKNTNWVYYEVSR